jgi:hypothetical protein
LESGNATTITFLCNTTSFAYGNHTLNAATGPIPGETNTGDNTSTERTVLVTIPDDLNGDFAVTHVDFVILANAYGSRPGHPNWNPNADLDNNGVIGLTDLATLAIHYGQHYPLRSAHQD